jgi:hypothetical protein
MAEIFNRIPDKNFIVYGAAKESIHVKTFLYDLNSFKTNLKSYDQRGNDILFSFIDDYLKVV